jgi:hypothetical protein
MLFIIQLLAKQYAMASVALRIVLQTFTKEKHRER